MFEARVSALALKHASVQVKRPTATLKLGVPVLITRLNQHVRTLKTLHQQFQKTPVDDLAAPGAAEWLLDNFYVIEQAARQIQEDHPAGYDRSLPRLSGASGHDDPRIFLVAREIVSVLDGAFAVDAARQMLATYQVISPLTIGELWALPTMLRLALVELLAHTLRALTTKPDVHDRASDSDMHAPLVPDEGLVANCFRSLRTIAAQDWEVFFEDTSLVEHMLRRDPSDIYARMDFATRNRYRAVVEMLAHRTKYTEIEVAQRAVVLASAGKSGDTERSAQTEHVGYYLVARGRDRLEQDIGFVPTRADQLQRALQARPAIFYLGGISVVTLFMVGALLWTIAARGTTPVLLAIAAVLSVLPVTTIAVTFMNWVVTLLVPPRLLARMDFEQAVPEAFRTMVVVPTLLSHDDSVKHLIQQLEQHYLRNNQPHLGFALLTDFADAPEQHMPEDELLVSRLREAVEALNVFYGCTAFYLFHRERRWNAAENCWMGWERKRGKLAEFNHLLRGANSTSYVVQSGDLSILDDVTFVITLDADTILTRDSAYGLIAALAHPLNRAVFEGDSGKVLSGYTLLQPRTETQPASANRSRFTKLFAGDIGLDLYTHAVSDVYQDLFGAGSYVGKGIYAVDDFERSLRGRAPENALLSHDLFEGAHGRVGLVTDIVLLEEYPPNYLSYMRRAHRWMRGDWQLLPWLFATVPGVSGPVPNALSLIDRWKILDNLRRSLTSPALLALVIFGWLWLPGSLYTWTVFAGLTLSMPALLSVISACLASLRAKTGSPRTLTARPIWMDAMRALLALVFLPFEAVLALDAVTTSLWRVFVTRRFMLEWTSAAHVMRLIGRNISLSVTVRQMAPALIVAVTATLILAALALIKPVELSGAVPVLGVWLMSPLIAYWMGRPLIRQPLALTEPQRWKLRALARQTWMFFEHFVGPQDNWLPPDHFQEQPVGIIAHQTSPTNIGLYLLSALAAYDFGYIRSIDLALRLRDTLASMSRLERHRGHFLNWYDTRSLNVLAPPYVSTVDSGNLAACLMALGQGCRGVLDTRVMRWEQLSGVQDALAWLDQVLSDAAFEPARSTVTPMRAWLYALRFEIDTVRADQTAWWPLLQRLRGIDRTRLGECVIVLIDARAPALAVGPLGDLSICVERLNVQLDDLHSEWKSLRPLTGALAELPALLRLPGSPASAACQALYATMPDTLTLAQCADASSAARIAISDLRTILVQHADGDEKQQALAWCDRLDAELGATRVLAGTITTTLQTALDQCDSFVQAMAFGFLFDRQRQIFHIGYNPASDTLDPNYYDLLASEARIASLVAIAKGDVPASHWLHLARPLTLVGGQRMLLSWSGTMFEYLMPMLLVRNYDGMFLSQSCVLAVDSHIQYGRTGKVPWGISESGYFAFDANQNYQYRAFGVPGLGFKRGLADDLVIAPYATILALPVRPAEALRNLDALDALQARGRYGMYEAIDFTPARMSAGASHAMVQSYMAHHQAMSLLSILNVLRGNPMVGRFHADQRIKSVELLLQERIPQHAAADFPHMAEAASQRLQTAPVMATPWQVPVDTPSPHSHVLSNGRFTSVITNVGTGFSQWRDISLTRWLADPTLDDNGVFIYIQDRDNEAIWSITAQPLPAATGRRSVHFSAHQADFQNNTHGIEANMQVVVAPDDDVEVRRITLTNHSSERRRLRLTSYGEVLLGSRAADQRHPAFNKLFVESEFVTQVNGLIFHRRPRASNEAAMFLVHGLALQPGLEMSGAHESDRARFLGRGRNTRNPIALGSAAWLSGSTGPVLDPVMSLGQDLTLEPGAHAQLAWVTAVAPTRETVLALALRYQAWPAIEQAFDAARMHSENELRLSRLTSTDLDVMEQVLSALLYPNRSMRAAAEILTDDRLNQTGLYAHGLSGEHPILLVRVREQYSPVLRDALRAHAYWRSRQIPVNLVLLNERDSGYEQTLDQYLHRLLARSGNATWLNRQDGIFIVRAGQLADADRALLLASARVILDNGKGTLGEQLTPLQQRPTRLPRLEAEQAVDLEPTPPVARPAGLSFDNGLGGFSPDGREYQIYLEPGRHTPAPWINVIANAEFGCLTSESGLGCTWASNSGENRLTPWRNDPVTDMPSEAIYLRDEETVVVWSPTPSPAPAKAPYLISHGAGYTRYVHHSHGIHTDFRVFAAPDAPVKLLQLRLANTWSRRRRITVTYYVDWVLGTTSASTRASVVSEFDAESQTILARNARSVEFGSRVAFVTTNKPVHGLTTDREEFLGHLGDMRLPDGLTRVGLSGSMRAGNDPCAALQIHVDLEPGATETLHFVLGQAGSRQQALELAGTYKLTQEAEAAWQRVEATWDALLGTVQVETPDRAMDLMLNRWLPYQVIACRLWGRTALYQSSGAFGFRDQLQDALALLHIAPLEARTVILNAARHQFVEGDVQHWWHPPTDRGVRTRCSDDMLWLPYVSAQYVAVTGDHAILAEPMPFLSATMLLPEEEDRYGQFPATLEKATLYDHCLRALQKGLTTGQHGLPLIGSGDWNDGMNRVGVAGRGESIWLGWFTHATLTRFTDVSTQQGDTAAAESHRAHALRLAAALEAAGWDGQWYRRAYYDDGTALGTAQDSECQIDSIAQSWAVLSGAAQAGRAKQAMQAVFERLVDHEVRVVLLLTPPFDKTPHDPGYIKGYPPGIRENGGQYTHAAVWAAWACAELGEHDRALALFQMLNPVNHADSADKISRYKVEPYVVAADIYSQAPHAGRGGWTWYTGSAGWLYRLGLEAMLGLQKSGNILRIRPRMPSDWPGFKLTYRVGSGATASSYRISVSRNAQLASGASLVQIDGREHVLGDIELIADGHNHAVIVEIN